MYAHGWEEWSMGKISALREASLAREIQDLGVSDLKYLYMGYYVHSCQKMRYKGEYTPSYLLDPEEYSWHSFQCCTPLLDTARYISFTHPPPHTTGQPGVEKPLSPNSSTYYDPLPTSVAGCLDPSTVASSDGFDDIKVATMRGNRILWNPVKAGIPSNIQNCS